MSGSEARQLPQVAIVGAGVIGLSLALELSRRGVPVALIGHSRPGEASAAAAGMLAPSVEQLAPPARGFGIESRDRYPDFLAILEEETGIRVPLDRRGILEVTRDSARAEAMRGRAGAGAGGAEWVEPERLRKLEPALSPVEGALYHADDGSVDSVLLMRALEIAADRAARIRRIGGLARRVSLALEAAAVELVDGTVVECDQLVIACGAWAAGLEGLPRPIPVRPLRGQMLALAATPLAHVVYADEGYLVPRGEDRTLVGATMEDAGFDPSTTEAAEAALRAAGERICPELRKADALQSWAALRPATPDLLPLLGTDPTAPRLLYACGHSRNGILMAPLTAECLAQLITLGTPSCSLDSFDIARFGS